MVEPSPTQDIPRTRLIEFGEAPSPTHQKIRDTIDRNEYSETESALRALGKTLIATPRDKAYVAALWNNLGVQQEKNGGIDVSVKAFKRAVALAPRNPTALLNLTQAYWGLRHPSLTPQFIEEVIQVVPDDPFPHLPLAELLVDKRRHLDAVPHLKRARARIPRDSNLTGLLEKLEGKTALLSENRVMQGPFESAGFSWTNAFLGLEPGSMGETSALACLIGAAILIVTRIGSWRTMAGVTLGTVAMALALNAVESHTNAWFGVPFWWHMVLGGWAFGTAFMATDPVTSPFSEKGKWVYGFLIGALIVLIRVVNPAYPESTMLVILFMNVMAPVIDYGFVRANIRRRERRRAQA